MTIVEQIRAMGAVLCHVLALALACMAGPGAWAHDADPTPRDILGQADRARGNRGGITWTVTVESTEAERTTVVTFEVTARGFDSLAVCAAPPKQKGNTLLTTNRNMWFYKPGLSKAVPISQRQKLMGNAAYGDIASTNYAEDYTPTVLADAEIDGEPCYVLDLKAKHKRVTYDRITYWVSKQRRVGVKAEYYTVSGKKFKAAEMAYENSVVQDGVPEPFISRITIHDLLLGRNVTTMTFDAPDLRDVSDSVFNLNLLVR